jgi:hypothetical protein
MHYTALWRQRLGSAQSARPLALPRPVSQASETSPFLSRQGLRIGSFEIAWPLFLFGLLASAIALHEAWAITGSPLFGND